MCREEISGYDQEDLVKKIYGIKVLTIRLKINISSGVLVALNFNKRSISSVS